jgi:hypothetical protein
MLPLLIVIFMIVGLAILGGAMFSIVIGIAIHIGVRILLLLIVLAACLWVGGWVLSLLAW